MWLSMGAGYQETQNILCGLWVSLAAHSDWASLFGLGEGLRGKHGEDPGQPMSPSATHWLIRPYVLPRQDLV